jgi:hypothetical protein
MRPTNVSTRHLSITVSPLRVRDSFIGRVGRTRVWRFKPGQTNSNSVGETRQLTLSPEDFIRSRSTETLLSICSHNSLHSVDLDAQTPNVCAILSTEENYVVLEHPPIDWTEGSGQNNSVGRRALSPNSLILSRAEGSPPVDWEDVNAIHSPTLTPPGVKESPSPHSKAARVNVLWDWFKGA